MTDIIVSNRKNHATANNPHSAKLFMHDVCEVCNYLERDQNYRRITDGITTELRKLNNNWVTVWIGEGPAPLLPDENPLLGYTLINDEKVCCLPEVINPPAFVRAHNSCDIIEEFISTTQADIVFGVKRAYYSRKRDLIFMPELESFPDTDSYYATLFHQLILWTGHPSRLKLNLALKRFGDGYAMNELVAELGAAFLCSDLGISWGTKELHTPYIANWYRAIRHYTVSLNSAYAFAQTAVVHLHSLTGGCSNCRECHG